MNFRFVLRRILLPFIGLIGLFMVIVLTINLSLFDQELSPEIKKIMQLQPQPPKQGNAYYAIWGLSAEANQDISDIGFNLVQRYLSNLNKLQKDELSVQDYEEFLGPNDLDQPWHKKWQFCAARTNQQCVISMAKQLIDKPKISPRLSLMLERYNQIIEMPSYKHISHVTFNYPLPPYGTLVKLRQIQLAQAFNQNSVQHFIEVMTKDLKFWKMLLRNGDTMIDKMIAVASIWGDLQALSNFVASAELNSAQVKSIETLLLGLTPQELDISESLIFEAKSLYSSLESISGDELSNLLGLKSWPILWLTQYNATNNTHYQKIIKPNLALAKMPTDAFYQLAQDNNKNPIETQLSISSLYNLGGYMLVAAGAINYSDYIARVHDLNGMFDLVRLQLLLKATRKDEINNVINNGPIKNQYTQLPFNYNPKDNSLSFKCLDKGSSCQVNF
jgi:hypothetical protein